MKRRANPEHYNDLKLVITMAQAVREYDVHRQTLTYAIDVGTIAAERCGRNVLISRRSLENYLHTHRS